MIADTALRIAAASIWQGTRVDAQAVFAGSIGRAVFVGRTLGFDTAVDRVTLIAAGAEADGVVVGSLADGVVAALGGFAGVSAAAGDASFTCNAVLKLNN